MGRLSEVAAGLTTAEEAKAVNRHRKADHKTSVKAAKDVAKTASHSMILIWRAIRAAGASGVIDGELDDIMFKAYGLKPKTDRGWAKRRSDLSKLQYLIANGQTRMGPSGKYQSVWVINPSKLMEA